MKTFQQLRAELKESIAQSEQYHGIGPDGIPCAMINNIRKPSSDIADGAEDHEDEIEQGKLDKNGVPSAVIFHGGHSLENFRVPKTVQESEDDEVNYFNQNDNAHIHPNLTEAGKIMGKSQVREGADIKNIRNYTTSSRALNKSLWKAHDTDTEPRNHVSDGTVSHDLAGLDEAVNRNKLSHDLHVFTGVGFDPAKLAAQHPSKHIVLPAFTSTSMDKTVARNFAASQSNSKPELQQGGVMGHVIHIALKKGQSGAYADPHSHFKGEQEFVLPRGTTLKVNKSEKKTDPYFDDYFIHHCTVVKKPKAKKV